MWLLRWWWSHVCQAMRAVAWRGTLSRLQPGGGLLAPAMFSFTRCHPHINGQKGNPGGWHRGGTRGGGGCGNLSSMLFPGRIVERQDESRRRRRGGVGELKSTRAQKKNGKRAMPRSLGCQIYINRLDKSTDARPLGVEASRLWRKTAAKEQRSSARYCHTV